MPNIDPISLPAPVHMDLSADLQACLFHFLTDVTKDKESASLSGASSILGPLARSLRRLLVHDELLLIWEDEGCAVGVLACAPGSPVAGDSPNECTSECPPELSKIQGWPASEQGCSALRVTQYSAGKEVRALRVSGPVGSAAGWLWIVCQGEHVSAEWQWLVAHCQALRSLYFATNAILRAQSAISEHRAALRAQVSTLLRKQGAESLPEAVALLKQLRQGGPAELDILQDVAVFMVQSALGSGWRSRSGIEELYEGVRLGQEALERAHDRGLEPLLCAVRCLRVLHSPAESLPADLLSSAPLDLLPLWTRIHEHWRPLCERPMEPSPGMEQAWQDAVERTRPQLRGHLAALNARLLEAGEDAQEAATARSLPSVRNLLYLWFCLRLLDEETRLRQVLLDNELCQLRAELAYLLRESLRFACFGDRPDYFFHAPTFTAALQVLIGLHAHHVIGLPGECAIGTLLGKIAREGGVSRLLAAEHFQHVVEVYISGHYLLSLRIEAAQAAADRQYLQDWTLGQAMAGTDHRRPDDEQVQIYLQAFSLAALFHDIDHLVLHIEPALGQGLALDADQVGESLDRLSGARRAATQEEASRWVTELLRTKFKYVRAGDDDQELRGWLEGQKKPGTAHHGLFSAWYLHLRCTDPKPQFKDALRMAVRAILMHSSHAVKIDAEVDPIAALLVLCDEVFEWDPALQTAPSEIGSNLLVIGTTLAPHVLRARSIRLRSLSMSRDSSQVCLALPPAPTELWPVLDLTLLPADRLDLPVFMLWLRKSRNLGRIQPTRYGFGPTLVVRSSLSSTLQRLQLSNARLLTLLAERIAPAYRDLFHDWVHEVCTGTASRAGEEVVTLGPLRRSEIYKAAFNKLRPELEQKAAALIQELQAALPAGLGRPPTASLPPPLSHSPVSVWSRLANELRTDSDFMAFCQDKFHDVYRRFANGMDRVQKLTMLRDYADAGQVSEALNDWLASATLQ